MLRPPRPPTLFPYTTLFRSPRDWRQVRAALLAAKWELALPLVAFAALFGGFATPVEAAALTAVYAFVVEVFVYRDLDLRRDVDRKSTRLNSSHANNSYAVFC